MGVLKTAIDAYNAEKMEKVPAEILMTMARCTEDLKQTGIEQRALRTGKTSMVSRGVCRTIWPNHRSC